MGNENVTHKHEADLIFHRHEHKTVNELPDSIEIGTPSKGGAVKVYIDASNPLVAKVKIAQAMELRQYAEAEYLKAQKPKEE